MYFFTGITERNGDFQVVLNLHFLKNLFKFFTQEQLSKLVKNRTKNFQIVPENY